MKNFARFAFVIAMLLPVCFPAFAGGGSESAEPENVTVSWWALTGGGGADDQRETWRREIISQYEAQNPNVTIDLTMLDNESFKQKIQVAVQAGNPPDIFHSWGGGVMVEYANAGALRDITSFVKTDLSKSIGMGALGVYGFDGKYYGAPYDMGAVGMWYNKAIFAELGLSEPKTWPELLDIVKATKAAGYIPIALGAGDRWPAHFWWVYLAMRVGGQAAFDAVLGGSGGFTDEPFVRAGELLQQLNDLEPFQAGFLGATYDDEAALVGNGKAVMELMGQWAPAVQASDSESGAGIGDDLGWFPFPAVPGGVGKNTDVMGGGNGYVIGANAPDAALDFLKFFLSKENNEKLHEIEGIIPVVKGAETVLASDPNAVKIAQTVASAGYYQLYADQFFPPAVGQAILDAVSYLLANQDTPEQAAKMIDDVWQSEK